ncbi:rod shape-determining protein MreC [Niabella ginsengisoli]|uniref:Cell shape-determining protein MreC n=1 Tax=Niabella ginsengisoli TaxID=522298 RepID=A0ABS9SQS6_9BACT|nr:rod shape-determining protein MreC [Niabella ginsengisoli]MCH5600591.1 rod shape-determining protein MreC [Niabella ginsengisoli]
MFNIQYSLFNIRYLLFQVRNIFLFIRRFSVFILFLILQIVSLYFLFTYNRSHRAKGLGFAGGITSYFNSKYNLLENFLTMQEENRRVHKLNDSLMNLLNTNFVIVDSGATMALDTLNKDTSGHMRRFVWRSAQVLYSTASSDKNYLQLNRGSSTGIGDDMGVFSSNGGLVGKVINTGENFSEVISLLNVVNKMSVQLKRTGSAGMLSWEGKSPQELTLKNIPKTDSVKRGDTIVTGNYSLSYPPGRLVGTVSKVLRDKASNFFILKIKPTANLTNLQQVFIVENVNQQVQKELDKQTQDMVEKKEALNE